MEMENLEAGGQESSEEVIRGLKAWREQHPKATLREIEAAVDEGLGRRRRQMLEDTALVSRAAEWEAPRRRFARNVGHPSKGGGKRNVP